MAITTYSQLKNATVNIIGGESDSTSGVNNGTLAINFEFTLYSGTTPAGGVALNSWADTATKNPLGGVYNNLVASAGKSLYITSAKFGRPSNSTVISSATGIIFDILLITSADSSGTALDAVGTGVKTINTTTMAARDDDASTNGKGVYAALKLTSNWSTGAGTATINYTNSAGVSGRTGTMIDASLGNIAPGTYLFDLQAGDLGVRSIQELQFSVDHVSGTCSLYLVRPILVLGHDYSPGANYHNALSLGLPKLMDNSILIPGFFRRNSFNYAYTLSIAEG